MKLGGDGIGAMSEVWRRGQVEDLEQRQNGADHMLEDSLGEGASGEEGDINCTLKSSPDLIDAPILLSTDRKLIN